MRPCYTFTAASENKPALLSIFDEIGFWGTQAKDFLASLAAIAGDKLRVEISSPGGDMFAGVAMYNGLRASGKEVTTVVMGVAASAASLIFMAGDKRVMPKNTHLMVHNPSNWFGGTADEHRETADLLDKLGATMRSTYAARSGMDEAELEAMFKTDTWLSAEESLANGMATEVVDDIRATASFDMSRADLPEAVRSVYLAMKPAASTVDDEGLVDDPENPDADIAPEPFASAALASATAAGFPEHAPMWAVACADMVEVTARIAAAREITSLCTVTMHPAQAVGFIRANKTIVEVRAALVELMANGDENVDSAPHIKNKQATRSSAKPMVTTTAALWASHNSQTKQ